MLVNIDVNSDDIKNGKACLCEICPVALALNRVLKPPYFVRVGGSMALIYTYTHSYKRPQSNSHIYLPLIACDFVRKFDISSVSNGMVDIPKPFSFEVEIDAAYLKG